MINLLYDYIGKSLPECAEDGAGDSRTIEGKLCAFTTNPNLRQKVKGRTLLPFYGNTAVFLLDEDTKNVLSRYQEELYDKAGWMLAEKLKPATFHMTLHDLENGPELSEALENRMKKAQEEAGPLLRKWQGHPPLKMEATWLFNMVNTSIVLGLAPADQDSGKRLDEMYLALNSVVPLKHALTPHITMAYYRPDTYTAYDLNCLKAALHPVNLQITLRMEDLVLQNFTDMNSYHTIP